MKPLPRVFVLLGHSKINSYQVIAVSFLYKMMMTFVSSTFVDIRRQMMLFDPPSCDKCFIVSASYSKLSFRKFLKTLLGGITTRFPL